jgi:hypothetical protein
MSRLGHVVLLFALGACAHDMALMKKEETLNAYGTSVRWNLFEEARSFQGDPGHSQRPATAFQGIKVTGYDVLSRREDKERQTVSQTVAIRYYRIDDLRERAVVDEQAWHFDPDREKWVIDTGLPRFE